MLRICTKTHCFLLSHTWSLSYAWLSYNTTKQLVVWWKETKANVYAEEGALNVSYLLKLTPKICEMHGCVFYRKSTFDMFDFLASQHRTLPENTVYDEEEDDLPLKSTRLAFNLLNNSFWENLSFTWHTSSYFFTYIFFISVLLNTLKPHFSPVSLLLILSSLSWLCNIVGIVIIWSNGAILSEIFIYEMV